MAGYRLAVPLLLLIRHALTNRTGKELTGWAPEIHLSERGREQAGELAQEMTDIPIAAVYSSPLERCIETAGPIARERGLKVRVRAALGEVHYGDWEGRSLRQLARTKLWTVVQRSPSAARFPGGEGLLEVQARMVAATETITRRHRNGVVAIVSHGDPLRLLLAHFLGLHIDLFQRLALAPASVSAVHTDGIPRILRVNGARSLDGLMPPARRAVRG